MNAIIRSLSTLLFVLAMTAGAASAQGPDLPNEEASEQGQENQQVIADCLDERGDPGDEDRGIGECVREEKAQTTTEEHGQSGEHGRPDTAGRPDGLPSGEGQSPGPPDTPGRPESPGQSGATPQGQPDTTGRPDSPGQSEATPPGPRR